MRKILFIALMSVISLGAFARGKKPVTFQKIPQVLQEAVLANYAENEVQLITCEKTMPRHYKYVFHLADGAVITYSHKAQLMNVANINGIKHAYVPAAVLEYVQATFPNAKITGYKFEFGVHKVEMNNAMTLLFSKKGKFMRIDE